MSGSMGKSKSDSSNNFSQDVWGPQGDALSGFYDQIGGAMGGLLGGGGKGGGGKGGGSGMMGRVPGAADQMQGLADQANPAWQNQMDGGAFAGMDLQGMYGDALKGGGNEQFMNQSIMGGQGNNYVDAMRGQMQNDSDTRLGGNLAMNDARAAGNQMSGSSRHGITEKGIYDQSEQNLGRMQTQMGFNTFDKDMDRKMGIAQRADQFDMGRLNNVSGMMGQQQGAMQGGLGMGGQMQNMNMGQFAPYMAPGNMMSQYSNMYGSPTVLGQGGGAK
mgnify:CR=1 FL=1